MFALWYAALTYKEYKDVILEKLPKKPATTPKETAVVCPLPPKKPESSKIPIVEPPKPPRTPSPLPPLSSASTPEYPLSPQATSTPITRSPEQKPLEPPAKPPRSPSPHPIKAEVLDDIEYEDEEEEEEDEGSEAEEENSVVSSPPPRTAQLSNTVNEFINQEISQPNSLRLNQTR
ncbi:hypothetical protein NQ315_015047 [Exocentrus adspersus]|uniref:Uncharacterized protein n=1 Tax=Exocentrus adspersus TaxID=1586481 RepID=A0AAV8VXW8_9CUCU|nr:hypothetical protein NQ315_015047 [Exocentrus adspersus]